MPKKINYGEMFVTPDAKRQGSFNAKIPTVWDEQEELTKYFGVRHYKSPKFAAQCFVNSFLSEYYGEVRAEFILSIPQFVQRMRFGCQVNIMDTFSSSRGRKYPKFAITWSEFNGRTKIRRQKTMLYNSENRVERHHQASLFAAKKRADLTKSNLDSSALNFEYDLTGL
ncbi:hypothetical protein H5300_24840 [Vibrio sp. SG41-7]|uniref:hypothetical protein n=1 Tax=Vibrio sp. SG41-7 TaxID=2760973 RepID=UPI0016048F9E|nr:hypothetical protein [Vibrio sp. SG41-7]MBB1466440.1 hypothetical protein [Vibrio sp. SG41-7]